MNNDDNNDLVLTITASTSTSKSMINHDCDKSIQLLWQQHLAEITNDYVIKELLAYIIYNEPITLYRISRSTRFAISTVYKKAKKMVQYGLIRPLGNDKINNERCVYISTVKGLLTCLALNCINDRSMIINKLCQKWRLRSYCCRRITSIINILPILMNIDDRTMRVLDDPKAIMILILEHRDQLRTLISYELFNEAIDVAMHYLINKLIVDDVVMKSSALISNDKFVISINPDDTAYVYACKLCERSCTGVKISVNDVTCTLSSKIKELKVAIF